MNLDNVYGDTMRAGNSMSNPTTGLLSRNESHSSLGRQTSKQPSSNVDPDSIQPYVQDHVHQVLMKNIREELKKDKDDLKKFIIE